MFASVGELLCDCVKGDGLWANADGVGLVISVPVQVLGLRYTKIACGGGNVYVLGVAVLR